MNKLIYDKQRILNNIRWLEGYQGIKENELEEKIGKSKQYIYRWAQEDSTIIPGIDSLIDIANALDVSLESLLTDDMTQARADDKEMLGYIQQLIEQTENDKLIWHAEPTDNLGGWEPTEPDYYDPENPGAPKHCLCDYDDYVNLMREEDDGKCYWGYNNLVDPAESMYGYLADGDFYHINVEPELKLYVIPLAYTTDKATDVPTDYDILFLQQGKDKDGKTEYKKIPVLATFRRSSEFHKATEELYHVIHQSQDRTHVEPAVRSIMSSYMQDKH